MAEFGKERHLVSTRDTPNYDAERSVENESSNESDDSSELRTRISIFSESRIREMRAAVRRSVEHICAHHERRSNTKTDKESLDKLSDLTFRYATELLANDLHAFSCHEGREQSLIKEDDVLITLRKCPAEILKQVIKSCGLEKPDYLGYVDDACDDDEGRNADSDSDSADFVEDEIGGEFDGVGANNPYKGGKNRRAKRFKSPRSLSLADEQSTEEARLEKDHAKPKRKRGNTTSFSAGRSSFRDASKDDSLYISQKHCVEMPSESDASELIRAPLLSKANATADWSSETSVDSGLGPFRRYDKSNYETRMTSAEMMDVLNQTQSEKGDGGKNPRES